MSGQRTWRPGERLVSPDEWEDRQANERQARLARFNQGAAAIERAGGGMQMPSGAAPPLAAQHPDMDSLAERFESLNQRYSE